VCRCLAVVDVGSDRVKRDLADLVAFASGNFRTTKSTGDLNLDSATVKSHYSGHCLSHGSSVANSLFKLNADILSN
jgi:hypothetical protein